MLKLRQCNGEHTIKGDERRLDREDLNDQKLTVRVAKFSN